MSDLAIRVENLGKQYRIGRTQRRPDTLRDVIVDKFQRRARVPKSADTIWALKDVSFEVKKGEVLGVIGWNGAGKSTLLKILSRITKPTEGRAEMHGRLATLLEVGTGFHPELTGRENVYLNGAIMGMHKIEIDRKFDEIVAFAEIEKFIDTPVKRFASGMYVRLAFAVAAHLEPEILLVDEVLAVGDAAFQKKCLGKMEDVAQQGRTILFVSHNLGQINRLCTTGLWLNHGRCVDQGEITEVIAAYQSSVANKSSPKFEAKSLLGLKGFSAWKIVDSPAGDYVLTTEKTFSVELLLNLDQPIENGTHGLVLQSPDGQNIASWSKKGLSLTPGLHRISYQFEGLPVRPGIYYWYASLWAGNKLIDAAHLRPELIVSAPDHSGLSEAWAGVLNNSCEIKVERLDDFVENV